MAVERIDILDYSKPTFSAASFMDQRGVVDYGNLLQFAPYETGYQLLAVINGPAFMNDDTLNDGRKQLTEAFISVLEQEFKGLDGIEDVTTEQMDISDNISTLSLISKSVQNTNATINMRYTEKAGNLLTKFISMYIRFTKDTKSEAKTYGGLIGYGANQKDPLTYPGFHMEVFNMLYIVTDSTFLNIEKAFLLLNAQPTTAAFGELFNSDKGDIHAVELTIPWTAYVVDGKAVNKLAKQYVTALVNTTEDFQEGKINVNSWNYNYSFSSSTGAIKKIGDLSIDESAGKLVAN